MGLGIEYDTRPHKNIRAQLTWQPHATPQQPPTHPDAGHAGLEFPSPCILTLQQQDSMRGVSAREKGKIWSHADTHNHHLHSLEQIVAGHAGLARHASRDDHHLCVREAVAQLLLAGVARYLVQV